MHLLATASASLEEASPAVDLGQTPAEVVILSFSDSDLSALAAAWTTSRAELPSLRLASLKHLRHPMSVDLYLDTVLSKARAVVVRCLGGLDYWRYGLERLSAAARERDILFVALPGDDRPDPRLARLSTADAETIDLLDRYFREGGLANAGNALRYVAHLLGRPASWRAPAPIGAAVAMDRDGTPTSLEELATHGADKPAALVVFYRASLLAADTAPITALMNALEGEGLAPLAVAVTSLKDPEAGRGLEALISARRPAIILNATAFSSLREDGTSVLDGADVPVLQVVLAGATREAWDGSPRGLGATDLAMNVVLPELDGRIVTRAISFKAEHAVDADIEYAPFATSPIPAASATLRALPPRGRAWGGRNRTSGALRWCSPTIRHEAGAPAMPSASTRRRARLRSCRCSRMPAT